MSASTLLAHEWLAPIGGSENVFERLTVAFPTADRVCLWNDAPERFADGPTETWLARTPLRRSKALALPFMGSAWRRVDLGGYDRVIASSHAFGHRLAARAVARGAEGFAYVHSPARYIWAPDHDHRGRSRVVRAVAPPLRWVDRRRADPRVSYAANSDFVRTRIRDAWRTDAVVIHPPVDVDAVRATVDDDRDANAELMASLPDRFVLGASRLVAYKRLDLVIEVAAGLGLPAVVAGAGPQEPELRRRAAEAYVPVHFVGRVSDSELRSLYRAADLFVFLAVEDFGIMPVEAMAAGTPVLVNAVGGAGESVHLTGGGVACSVDSVGAVLDAARAAVAIDMTGPARACERFSHDSFAHHVHAWAGP